ncbi:MAG TPA: ATP-binding protein [Anaeromyxobacteraceae bacterium]|nr:ATP-binding protein [Anaeromyxobacteraceae bacterium]
MPATAKPSKTQGVSAAHGWLWYLPRFAVGLFVLSLFGLLWVLYQQELEVRRSGVVRDILWVQQNVRVGISADVEQLGRLGADWDGAATDPIAGRAAAIIQGSAGLVRVAILDGEGRVLLSVPASRPGSAWPGPESAEAKGQALSGGVIAWGGPYGTGQDRRFDVFVPRYRGGARAGAVVGVYGLRVLLAGAVPWWLAERHLATIRDARAEVLASRSDVEATRPEVSQEVPLDPPGHGMTLRLESWGGERQRLRDALVAVLVALALAVLWNLWALRRHVRRRLATEEALRAEHAFRKAMEDSLHTGMRAVDLSGRIVYVNPAFCHMVGYSEEEILGAEGPPPWWPAEERASIEAGLRASRERGMPRTGLEMKLVRRGGERFDALVYEAPLIDAEGRQKGWMGSVLDITERKRARELVHQQEEKLAATARLVTMGEMASTLAHELNQPLSAIAGYTTGCLNLIEAGDLRGEPLRDALRKTAQQAQRAGRIIRRVHDFVRKSEPARGPVRMNAVVEEAVGFVEAEARKRGVAIRTLPAAVDPELQADRLLLQQVVLNLVRNAMDAMAETPPEAREIRVATVGGADAITVAIADRGAGIAPGVRERLFEPFFTTKGEGMGMGLNICRSIVELHRGRLWAEPNPGGGTIFSFTLPVDAA